MALKLVLYCTRFLSCNKVHKKIAIVVAGIPTSLLPTSGLPFHCCPRVEMSQNHEDTERDALLSMSTFIKPGILLFHQIVFIFIKHGINNQSEIKALFLEYIFCLAALGPIRLETE